MRGHCLRESAEKEQMVLFLINFPPQVSHLDLFGSAWSVSAQNGNLIVANVWSSSGLGAIRVLTRKANCVPLYISQGCELLSLENVQRQVISLLCGNILEGFPMRGPG